MPIQHQPPTGQTVSQARAQAFLTQTPTVPLDGTPAAPQLRAPFGRSSTIQETRGPRRSSSFSGVVGCFPGLSRTTLEGPGEYCKEKEENSVGKEESNSTEGVPAPVGESQGTGGLNLALSNQPVCDHSGPSLLAIMQQMTQIRANLQAASISESSRPEEFKTPSMKTPECFDGAQPFRIRSFIWSFQLIVHNDLANLSQDRNKVLHSTSFLVGRAAKWIKPDISNKDPNYLLNSWKLFESQLFTLFKDPNEVRKAEAALDSLRMKEGEHVSL
ncbi:hypothetical protein O181_071846 [Austropuccinia psidii MF-1]|uniref:Retrotransposon gag domain-containing protein n=1 Tax=Austropuccinia psidii MF-1 TaxID=1389203 RepID=A0A9Q3F826_9BASI|nr:hypothetical protein [Austropuccinia psidii MF-1]